MKSKVETLRGEHELVVYIDLKSPYAFIAVDPTRAMARGLDVAIDWRPFTLDIPSYLGSARVDGKRKVVSSNRTAEQWTGVRYAYRDARRYASLSGKTLRGTEKIWDSSLAGIAMLWAKKQGAASLDRFLDEAYRAFWRRELDIEDVGILEQVLRSAGVEVNAFADYVEHQGRVEHDELNEIAFEAGVYGVPTYLVGDEMWFGREHLPRVAWLLENGSGESPDVANQSFGRKGATSASNPRPVDSEFDLREPELTVILDIRYPQAYLALHPAIRFARDRGLSVDWLPLSASTLRPPTVPGPDEDRGIRHRRFRAEATAREIEVYADMQGLAVGEIYRAGESTAFNLGWLWMREFHETQLVNYLSEAFRAYWVSELDPSSEPEVAALLERLDGDLDVQGFRKWARNQGVESLEATSGGLGERGVFAAPSYLFQDQVFLGRQHLPMIDWQLGGQTGEIPI